MKHLSLQTKSFLRSSAELLAFGAPKSLLFFLTFLLFASTSVKAQICIEVTSDCGNFGGVYSQYVEQNGYPMLSDEDENLMYYADGFWVIDNIEGNTLAYNDNESNTPPLTGWNSGGFNTCLGEEEEPINATFAEVECATGACTVNVLADCDSYSVSGSYDQVGEIAGRPRLVNPDGISMYYYNIPGDNSYPIGWYIIDEQDLGFYYNPSDSQTPPTEGWEVFAYDGYECGQGITVTTENCDAEPPTPICIQVTSECGNIGGVYSYNFESDGYPVFTDEDNNDIYFTEETWYIRNVEHDILAYNESVSDMPPTTGWVTDGFDECLGGIGEPINATFAEVECASGACTVNVLADCDAYSVSGLYDQVGVIAGRPRLVNPDGYVLYYYYFAAGDINYPNGWYIVDEEDLGFYYNPSDSQTPPTEGWEVFTYDGIECGEGITVTQENCDAEPPAPICIQVSSACSEINGVYSQVSEENGYPILITQDLSQIYFDGERWQLIVLEGSSILINESQSTTPPLSGWTVIDACGSSEQIEVVMEIVTCEENTCTATIEGATNCGIDLLDINGVYSSNAMINDRPLFTNTVYLIAYFNEELAGQAGWYIGIQNEGPIYYNPSNASLPPSEGWIPMFEFCINNFTLTVEGCSTPPPPACTLSIDCPTNVIVNTTGSACTAVAAWEDPTLNSNCEAGFSADYESGSSFEIGSTTVTYTAANIEWLTATCSFEVVVTDGGAPTAICKNVNKQLAANGTATLIASEVNNGSNDACGSITNMSLNKTSFDCSNLGSNTVTLTVTDEAGNTSACSSVITVSSNLPSTGTCPAPSVVPTVAVSGNNATFSWMQNCYTKFRVQYRRTTPANASWSTKLVNAPASSTSIMMPSAGTYRWGLVSSCNGINQFSSLTAGNNYVIGGSNLVQANMPTVANATAWPNPTKGMLNISVNPSTSGTCLVRMFDQLGRSTYTASFFADGPTEKQWSVENMPNGLYYVQILVAGQDPITKSVIVQH